MDATGGVVVDAVGVTAGKLAKALGVTDQTVRNWAKKGLVAAASAGLNPDGVQLYRVDAAKAWAEKYTGGTVGGRRPGSGRKAGLWAAAAAKPAAGKDAAAASGGKIKAAEVASLEREERDLLSQLGDGARSLEELMEMSEKGLLPVSQVQAIRAIWDSKTKRLAYEVQRGKLVDAAEVATSLMEFLSFLRRELEQMPSRIAQSVCQAIGNTSPAAMVDVRKIIAVETDRFIDNVAGYGKSRGVEESDKRKAKSEGGQGEVEG